MIEHEPTRIKADNKAAKERVPDLFQKAIELIWVIDPGPKGMTYEKEEPKFVK